jgi:hypothetical protein
MDDGKISRPSNLTIQAFINSPSQINLPSISKAGDVAYVIFQKTGFNSTTVDINVNISPVFIIWKLTCSNRLSYLVDQGFPKFHRAQTVRRDTVGSNEPQNWNQPQNWSAF